MKKYFSFAAVVAFVAAVSFASCTGNSTAPSAEENDTLGCDTVAVDTTAEATPEGDSATEAKAPEAKAETPATDEAK